MGDQKIIPEKKQLEFLDWEFGVFFHFGIRSFFRGHKDWDNREMPASVFNPERLDCDGWIRAIRDAGAKYAVLVCKHHDGFANWPTKYSDYSVKASPWKNGEGDVVAEYVAACRKYGIKVGLYYSPAQWGGKVSFENDREYDDYFIGQIGELLSNYGKIDYLWFDGCGSENHEYDRARIVSEIRRMQPEILVFEMWDPDTRWVGNEDGYADMPNTSNVRRLDFSMNATRPLDLAGVRFLPAECDCMMRNTWFDCEENEDKIKSVEELMGMYEMSVGRGANLLLNIGPDSRGMLPEKDAARLAEFGREIRRRYGAPVPGFSPLAPDEKPDSFSIQAAENALVNRVVLEEDLTDGEHIEEFRVYAHLPHYTAKRVCVYQGCTMGHKAICVFPTIRTARLTVEISRADGAYRVKDMRAYFA